MSYKVTIEPLFKYAQGFSSIINREKDIIVQSDRFKLGLKITNIGPKPTPPFKINNIKVKSSGGSDILHVFEKEYAVGSLNPDEQKIYWISDFGTDMYGLANISLRITPPNDEIVEAHQISRFNSEEVGYQNNSWIDFFYIKSSHEHTQEKTNNLLLVLTFVMALIAIVPLVINYLHWRDNREATRLCLEDNHASVTYRSTGLSIECEEYLEIRKLSN